MPSNTAPSHPIVEKPLHYFEVSEYGTITDPTVPEAKCNRDVFANVSPQHLDTIEDLVFRSRTATRSQDISPIWRTQRSTRLQPRSTAKAIVLPKRRKD